MISNELSTIQHKNAERALLAEAMASFQGQVTVIDAPIVRNAEPQDWRRTMSLPGSADASVLDAQEARMVEVIRNLAAKGAGITSMQKTLNADVRRIRRLAKAAGITIPDARSNGPRSLGATARAARVAAGTANRAALAEKLRPLAAEGATIQAMQDATGACKRTVLRTLAEHNITRGK